MIPAVGKVTRNVNLLDLTLPFDFHTTVRHSPRCRCERFTPEHWRLPRSKKNDILGHKIQYGWQVAAGAGLKPRCHKITDSMFSVHIFGTKSIMARSKVRGFRRST